MKRKSKQANEPYKLTRNKLIIYGSIAAVISVVAYAGWYAMIPVNATTPVFQLPNNHSMKAVHGSSAYEYISLSSGSVKGARTSGGGGVVNPTYVLSKGVLQSMHFINEDQQTHSDHNLNIDAFNVHSRTLHYTESQTINFIPDKTGTFEYYCTVHPEMKGEITVEG